MSELDFSHRKDKLKEKEEAPIAKIPYDKDYIKTMK